MTQRNLIFSFIQDNPNLRPIEIAKILDIPAPSVRRAIFHLRKELALSLPNKQFTVEAIIDDLDNWKRYIINAVMYCSSKPKTIRATTWSSQDFDSSGIKDLMNDMLIDIYAEYSGVCSDIQYYDAGLDITNVSEPNEDYIYPNILVGDLVKTSKRGLSKWQ